MYTIIIKRKGKADMKREHVDRLNAIVIAAELKMRFKKEIKKGNMEVEVVKE